MQEDLPKESTEKWVKELCQKIGPVAYLNVPMFKSEPSKYFAVKTYILCEASLCI